MSPRVAVGCTWRTCGFGESSPLFLAFLPSPKFFPGAAGQRLTQIPPDRTADHDIDDQANTQTNIYAGRGLLIESTAGPVWLVGTAVEHHTLYNYQLSGAKNVYASQLQTETPYFQPHPNALSPFPPVSALNDPTFDCTGVSGNCAMSWGLRVVGSSDVFLYGANHYSFFNDYSTCEFYLPCPFLFGLSCLFFFTPYWVIQHG